MKVVIHARAMELGFDDCRFTSADPPESSPQYTRWIESGQHGHMGYLARNARKRVNPHEVLPGARSVICVAMNYGEERDAPAASTASRPRPRTAVVNPDLPGIVARYARYQDYHDVMGQRLRTLTQFVDQLTGTQSKSLWYVDTGPVLERALAHRAGIGFVGKHTNVISRKLGNWILLGEILTTLHVEPDTPETNRCGNCSRCLAACPTDAITAPFRLDARRCISYLTIELKGSIPVELRPAIGSHIFGCDVCLDVCPWNRFARASRVMQLHGREDLRSPELLDLLSLDNAGFTERFRGTPIARSKRRGLLRNVCVALGNVGGQESLPALAHAARDPEPLIAEHATWAIQQIRKRVSAA